MKLFLVFWVGLLLKGSYCYSMEKDYTQWVNPFIGTLHEGHCFPGATVPMGMVQASPESATRHYKGYEMDHVAGYQYTDSLIGGFTQTHLNGVGCPSMSDILLMPFCGRNIEASSRENIRSTYTKKSEKATPGYYKVELIDNKVTVELTATEHAAYHRYRYNEQQSARLLIDLQYGVSWDITTISENVIEASQQFEDEYTLTGYRCAKEWAARKLFYVIKFNKKVRTKKQLPSPENKIEKAPRYLLSFDLNQDNSLEVMIGLSTVGIEDAKKNLEVEIKGWNSFNAICKEAKDKWNKLLSRVVVKGDDAKRTSFYTSMYHLYIQPNNIADVSGRYRAENDSIYTSGTGKYYSTFSLWDTFRAAHPMYTLLSPSLVGDFATSLLDSYAHKTVNKQNPAEANKYLPRWQLWGKETHTMVGNHAVPVLVEAWLKGLKSTVYSDAELYEAIKETVTKPHYRNHVELIDKYGYIPYDTQIASYDDGRETVSRLLECIYDDYCASLLAYRLEKEQDGDFLYNRSRYYENVFDKDRRLMVGRNAAGDFKKKIDITEVVGEWLPESDYTEGNSSHYLFHVQHDIPELMKLMGGERCFASKLDSIFYSSNSPQVKSLVWNIFGTLGQYWHGNEPCHHIPYLYKYTSEGYKTDALIRYLVDHFYKNAPDGLKGNDDCGQMSAWYLFATMGFYPVNPVEGKYILGAPQFPFMEIKLENGKTFRIVANKISADNKFVENVELNDKRIEGRYITHSEIMAGGILTFNMGSRWDSNQLIQFNVK